MKFRLLTLFGTTSLIFAPFLCSSCACSKQQNEPKILFGDQREYYAELTSGQTETIIKINGFSFQDLPSANLSVTLITSNSSTVTKTEITDFNKTTKTFNVLIKFSNCDPKNDLNGVLQFMCDGKSVIFSAQPFHFLFFRTINIKKPVSELSKDVILNQGIGTTTLKNFVYDGDIISPDLVKCNFVTNALVAIDSCKIINFSKENKSFDVELSISGCSSGQTINGNFEFFFNNKKLNFDGETNDFKLTFKDEMYISQSLDNNIESFYSTGVKATATFTKFRFNGIKSADQIEMVANFTNKGESKSITPVITNFDITNRTFDINFTIDNENDIGDWKGTIEFKSKVSHESLLKTTEMEFVVLFAISEDYLDIQKKEEGSIQKYVLCGIKNYPAESKFNTLYVPSQVSEIADSAFASKIISTGELKTIKYLSFDKNIYLKKIGSQAFKDCSLLSNNLILPSTVTEIGSEAFCNCTSFDGTLFVPANQSATSSPQLPIWSCAFQNCKFKTLDLSDYPMNFLPEWNLSADNKILDGWNDSGSIVVCDTVFSEQIGYKSTLKNKLLTYSLSSNWTFVEK